MSFIDSPTSRTPSKNGKTKFELSPQQIREIKQAFDLLDVDASGKIVGRDMKVVLRALGYEPTKDELNKMISDVDKEGLGLLDFNEFLEILLRKMGEKDTKEDMAKAFELFDIGDTKKITFEDLKVVAAELGEARTDEELMEMIEYCTKQRSKDKKESMDPRSITQDEFLRLMKKCNAV